MPQGRGSSSQEGARVQGVVAENVHVTGLWCMQHALLPPTPRRMCAPARPSKGAPLTEEVQEEVLQVHARVHVLLQGILVVYLQQSVRCGKV